MLISGSVAQLCPTLIAVLGHVISICILLVFHGHNGHRILGTNKIQHMLAHTECIKNPPSSLDAQLRLLVSRSAYRQIAFAIYKLVTPPPLVVKRRSPQECSLYVSESLANTIRSITV